MNHLNDGRLYVAPETEVFKLTIEQCILSETFSTGGSTSESIDYDDDI